MSIPDEELPEESRKQRASNRERRAEQEAERDAYGFITKKRSKGASALPLLPVMPCPLYALRNWLTWAARPEGRSFEDTTWRVEEFVRHGLGDEDPCDIVLTSLVGGRKVVRIPEQRKLGKGIRRTLTAYSQGFLAPGHFSEGEAEDVFIALVLLAAEIEDQTQTDEMREFLQEFQSICDVIEGHTLAPSGRDALLRAAKGRDLFNSTAAKKLPDKRTDLESSFTVRPAMFVDARTGARIFSVSELRSFVLICKQGGGSYAALKHRMRELGFTHGEFWVGRSAQKDHGARRFFYET